MAKVRMALAGAVVAVAAWWSTPLQADDDAPGRPVTYVVPFDQDGESDVAARLQATFFKKLTGRDLIIDNRPGREGAVTWARLGSLSPDGFTVVAANLPNIVLQPLLREGTYETRDIDVVYFSHYTPDAIVVGLDSPFHTLADLVAAARKEPFGLTIAGTGFTSGNHMMHRRFNDQFGIRTTYLPLADSTAVVEAILTHRVAAAANYASLGVHWPKDVRVLAVASEQRLRGLPEAPTFRELGGDIVGGVYRGVAVPPNTPDPIRRELGALFDRINRDSLFARRMQEKGFAMTFIGPDEVGPFVAAQQLAYEDLLRDIVATEPLAEVQRW